MIKKNMKVSSKTSLIVASIIFGVTLLGQIYVTNTLAVRSKDLVMYSEKKAQLNKSLSELQLEKSSYEALSYVDTRARELGFIDNENFMVTIAPVSSTAVATVF